MRKINAVLTGIILLLFLLHGILGSFLLLGVGDTAAKAVAWAAAALILLHTLIGVKFTADTLRVLRKTGVSYFKENWLFWARRVSGFAVMLLLFFHFTAFGDSSRDAYRLKEFGRGSLSAQLLLAAAIALHVLTNVKPQLIAFGVRSLRPRTGDVLFVLSVLMLLFAAAFLVYYLRWNRI